MIVVPEVILYNIIVGGLKAIKTNYTSNTDKTITYLYQMFHGLVEDKKDYYTEAIALFTRSAGDVRQIEVRKFYDETRAKVPTIHITMPQETTGQNGLGVGQGIESFSYLDDPGDTLYQVKPIYERRFDTQFHLVFTSDNHAEVLLMYHTFRAYLISAFDTITLSGMQNASLSGQDLKMQMETSANPIYSKALGLKFSYDIQVPRIFAESQIDDILVESTLFDNQ